MGDLFQRDVMRGVQEKGGREQTQEPRADGKWRGVETSGFLEDKRNGKQGIGGGKVC